MTPSRSAAAWIFPSSSSAKGEAGFRQRESRVIDELTRLPGIVLATGGGSAQDPENRQHLRERGFVVYLHATVDQQLKRTRRGRARPMLKTR